MPTLAEAKTQALALAAQLRQQAAQLRTLESPIVGLTVQAVAIEAAALAIEAAANAAIEPPVIVLSRTTITPDDVPGANDQEKVVNAHAEAVSRGRPMRWNRRILVKGITLTEAHDRIKIIADPNCGPVLSSEIANPQGLLYQVMPTSGRHAEIRMKNLSMLGNKANTPNDPRQYAVTIGNPGNGTVRLIIDDTTIEDFEHAGIMVWGNGCEVIGNNVRVLRSGQGFATTRGRMLLTNCEAGHGELGFNASAGEYNEFINCWSHHNSGGGAKISLRSGETDASGAAYKARLHLVGMRIEDNGSVGLNSTSGAPGSLITGSVAFARNAGGALNISDEGVNCDFDAVSSVEDGPATPSDSTGTFLMSAPGRIRFDSLDIRNSRAYGINGGWGRELIVGRLSINGCAGAGLRWVNAPIVYDEYAHAGNGLPDELVNNG